MPNLKKKIKDKLKGSKRSSFNRTESKGNAPEYSIVTECLEINETECVEEQSILKENLRLYDQEVKVVPTNHLQRNGQFLKETEDIGHGQVYVGKEVLDIREVTEDISEADVVSSSYIVESSDESKKYYSSEESTKSSFKSNVDEIVSSATVVVRDGKPVEMTMTFKDHGACEGYDSSDEKFVNSMIRNVKDNFESSNTFLAETQTKTHDAAIAKQYRAAQKGVLPSGQAGDRSFVIEESRVVENAVEEGVDRSAKGVFLREVSFGMKVFLCLDIDLSFIFVESGRKMKGTRVFYFHNGEFNFIYHARKCVYIV